MLFVHNDVTLFITKFLRDINFKVTTKFILVICWAISWSRGLILLTSINICTIISWNTIANCIELWVFFQGTYS